MGKFQVVAVLGLVMVLWFSAVAPGQVGSSVWHFGGYAGIDFNTNPPTILNDGAMLTSEGCATVTDAQGNLLLYTNGVNVFNRLHQQMPNGYGLAGHGSSTQSAVVVPQPGNDSVFYIFTTPAGFNGNFCYSKVNITLENGLGDVTLKNEMLHSNSSEQLSAVKHPNGIDYWVVARRQNTNEFRAYMVTAAGVNPGPVISALGPSIGNAYGGQLKFSPDGTQLAHAGLATAVICDFDGVSGLVSNARLLVAQPVAAYGLEFSPSGKYLYVANTTTITQWDISLPTLADIANSRQTIVPALVPTELLGALQLAPDGKIYVAKANQQNLGVINLPEQPMPLCDYQHFGLNISPGSSAWGLPTSIQSSILTQITIEAQHFCSGAATQFSTPSNPDLQNHLWNFGDPASGVLNTSSDTMPTHIYSLPGQYTVALVGSIGTSVYTQTFIVTILPAPTAAISPPGPLNLCSGTTRNLQATALPGLSYQWLQNGQPLANDTLPALTVSASGNYQVLVSDGVCSALSDTVEVTVHPQAEALVSPSNSDPVCQGETITLNASQSTGNTYAWLQNGQLFLGANGPVFDAGSTGNYQVIVSSNGFCADTSGAVAITIMPVLGVSISVSGGPDFCDGDSAILAVPNSSGASYQWQINGQPIAGATNHEFVAQSAGSYQIVYTAPNSACPDTSFAMPLTVLPVPEASIIPATAAEFCEGQSVNLTSVQQFGAGYTWLHNGNPGYGADTLVFAASSPGSYQVVATFVNGCSDTSDVVQVSQGISPQVGIQQLGDVSCTEPITLTATGADTYLWSTGATETSIIIYPGAAGFYAVTGQNQFGCQDSDSVDIPDVICNPLISVPNIITPNNDGVNDVFEFTIEGQDFGLQIFNRWGNEVFNRANYNRQPDWNAAGLPNGVYFYYITAADGKTWKGWVEVVR